MFRRFAALILIFHGLTDIFALSSFLSITMLSEIAYMGVIIWNKRIRISSYTVWLLFFLTLLLLAFSAQTFSVRIIDEWSIKNIRTHIFLLIHVVVYTDIVRRFGANFFLRYYFYGFFINILFGLIDMLLSNVVGFHLDNILPRNEMQFNSGTIGSLYRMRSGFRESGYFAHYLNISMWILLLLPKYQKSVRRLYFLGLIASFSVTGMVAALITYLTYIIVFVKNLLLKTVVITVVILGILGIGMVAANSQNLYLRLMYRKVMLNKDDASASDRLGRYDNVNTVIKDLRENDPKVFLWGVGNGYFKENSKTIGNLYLMYLLENGLVVFVSYITFVLYSLWITYKKSRTDKRYVNIFLAILVTSLHYLLIQSVFTMFAWLPFIFAYSMDRDEARSVSQ